MANFQQRIINSYSYNHNTNTTSNNNTDTMSNTGNINSQFSINNYSPDIVHNIVYVSDSTSNINPITYCISNNNNIVSNNTVGNTYNNNNNNITTSNNNGNIVSDSFNDTTRIIEYAIPTIPCDAELTDEFINLPVTLNPKDPVENIDVNDCSCPNC